MEAFDGQFKTHQVVPDLIDHEPILKLEVNLIYIKNLWC